MPARAGPEPILGRPVLPVHRSQVPDFLRLPLGGRPARLLGEHVRGTDGLLQDLAAFEGAEEALVGSLVPGDARLVLVAPEAVGLRGRYHPVDRPGEDGPAVLRDQGLQREGETGLSSASNVALRTPSALREWVASASVLCQKSCDGSTAGFLATAQSRSSSRDASSDHLLATIIANRR